MFWNAYTLACAGGKLFINITKTLMNQFVTNPIEFISKNKFLLDGNILGIHPDFIENFNKTVEMNQEYNDMCALCPGCGDLFDGTTKSRK